MSGVRRGVEGRKGEDVRGGRAPAAGQVTGHGVKASGSGVGAGEERREGRRVGRAALCAAGGLPGGACPTPVPLLALWQTLRLQCGGQPGDL